MSDARNNNFTVIFSAVVAVVSIGLAVLVFLAHKNYSTVSDTYDQQAAELQRLQSLTPYPDQENLSQLKQAKDALQSSIAALRSDLAARSIETEPINPTQFQDRLREMLAEITRLAAEHGVALEEGFYLGFEQYQDVPPSPAAAPALYRQLKAIHAILRRVIEARVATLAIERALLPEESGAVPAASAQPNARQASAAPVLERSIIRIKFTCDGGVLRLVMNSLMSADQFLIIRTLTVQNESLEGPARGATLTTPGTAGQPAIADLFSGTQPTVPDGGAATTAAAPERLAFIVGQEKIDVDLHVELIDFLKPETVKADN